MGKKIKFTEDYKVAELPQNGGRIIDAKKDEVHSVSLELAELIKSVKKGEDYVEPTTEQDDEDSDQDKDPDADETTGEGGEGGEAKKTGFLGFGGN